MCGPRRHTIGAKPGENSKGQVFHLDKKSNMLCSLPDDEFAVAKKVEFI